MKYTPLQPDEIRQKVYQEAKRQFLEKGLTETEMKKLAEAVGIGRTTLYRYYPGLEHLAYKAATEFWDLLFEEIREENVDPEKTGYENLVMFYGTLVERLELMPRELHFFRQFEALYELRDFSDIPEAIEFDSHRQRVIDLEEKLVQMGREDGSLRTDLDGISYLAGIGHALFGYEELSSRWVGKPFQFDGKMLRWIAETLLENLRKKPA